MLCFLSNKYGKAALKTIKVTLTDFYSADKLSEAKFQLTQDIDMMNLSSKRPHNISQRRDGDGRITREVDDILSIYVHQ